MTQLLEPDTAGAPVSFDDLEIGEIALDLDDQDPEDVIAWGLETFGDRIAIVTAMQADGMAILDMAAKIKPDVRVITVDTGRLPQETYAYIDEMRKRYPETRWDIPFPDAAEVEASWAVIDPLEEAWAGTKPAPYRAGEWGPAEADEMLAHEGRSWRRA